jgi:hypothetical protein
MDQDELHSGGTMKRHLAYLKYVLRHKWFVLVASFKIGAPIWRAIFHDMSKFLPSEWMPYACCFYAPDGSKQYKEGDAFTFAWNYHQKRNKHHWQYFLITWDRGTTEPLSMPVNCVYEMVADWMGAGRAITGKWETLAWYEVNKTKMILHPDTRLIVEWLLKGKEKEGKWQRSINFPH